MTRRDGTEALRVMVRGHRTLIRLASPILVHELSRDGILRHRPGVVVHFGLRLLHLRAVVARAGDAGVGAGLSGAAHDGGEVGVGRRWEVSFLSDDGLVVWTLGGGWRRMF